MKETRVYCDACGTELTDDYPGEDYTIVPVKEANHRHHGESEQEMLEYHLCDDEVEPYEFRSSYFFRAREQIPMLLNGRTGYEFVPREDFNERHEEMAEVLEDVWDAV